MRDRLAFKPLDYASMVGFLAYSSSVTATPICLVAISRELDLSLSQAGGLEATRSILVVLVLLISGYVGARLGKARALGISCLVLGIVMVCYSFAPGYGALLLALALVGVGGGVVEALINPLVQELHPEDSGKYLNITNAFWSIGVLLTMLGTGELLDREVSWRYIVGSLGAVSLIAGILFMSLRRQGRQHQGENLSSVMQEKWAILQSGKFWVFTVMMFLGGAAEGAFTFWTASFIQLSHGAGARAAGVGVALFAAGMITARFAFGAWVPQWRLWDLLFYSAIFGVAASVAIPLLESLSAVYVGLFLGGVSVACFWPTLQAYAVDRMRFDPTGVFILLSCGGIGGFAMVSWVMGIVGDHYGLVSSFWIIPGCLGGLAATLLWERRGVPRGRTSEKCGSKSY